MKVVAPPKGAHLASPTGAVFILKPNEVRDIPEYLKRIAFDKGCRPAPADLPQAEPAPAEPPPAAEDDRAVVRRVISEMVDAADPELFTTAGRPKIAIVRERAGMDVSVAMSNELFDEVMGEHEGS